LLYLEEGKRMMNKKGQAVFTQLAGLGIGIAGLVITLVVVFLILSQARTQTAAIEGIDLTNETQVSTSVSLNATATLTEAVATVPGWVPLIVIAVIGSILLGLVALFRRG